MTKRKIVQIAPLDPRVSVFASEKPIAIAICSDSTVWAYITQYSDEVQFGKWVELPEIPHG